MLQSTLVFAIFCMDLDWLNSITEGFKLEVKID